MLKFEIIAEDGGIEKIIKDIKRKKVSLYKSMVAIGEGARARMVEHINNTAKRSHTGKVASSINIEKYGGISGNFEIGIGNTSVAHKSWWVLNFGTRWDTGELYFPPATGGAFDGTDRPEFSEAGGSQVWMKPGAHYIKPNKPITPMYYIEEGKKYINNILRVTRSGKRIIAR